MSISCCGDVEAALHSLPPTYRKAISSVLCNILNQSKATNVTCFDVKDCETLTSISDILLNGTTLSFIYYDENGVGNNKEIDLAQLFSSTNITANNALTKTANNIQLGGALVKNTNITADYDLGIKEGNLGVGYTAPFLDKFKFGSNLDLSASSTLTGSLISSVSSSVNVVDNVNYTKLANIQVYPITTVGSPSYSGTIGEYVGVNIETLGRVRDLGTGDLTKTYGIKQEGDVSNWVQGHLTISTYSDPENANTLAFYPAASDRPRLYIAKIAGYSNIAIQTASETSLVFQGSGSDLVTGLYAANSGTFYWEHNNNQTLRATTSYSASLGNMVIETDGDITDGILSSYSSNILVLSQTVGTLGTVEHVTGFRALPPKQEQAAQSAGKIFDGITNVYGLMVDDQRSGGLNSIITNSWGIYQSGASDNNYFKASVGIGIEPASSRLMLQVDSTTKGSLPAPRMTITQRDAMTSASIPLGGTMIYNTTSEEYQYYRLSTNTWIAL